MEPRLGVNEGSISVGSVMDTESMASLLKCRRSSSTLYLTSILRHAANSLPMLI